VSPWHLVGLEWPQRGFADVLSVCVPALTRPEVETAARVARKGDISQALTLLPPPRTFREDRSEAAVALFRSILEARVSLPTEVHAARRALQGAIGEFDDPHARVCGWTERARLALRARLAGEAIGDLAIAARILPDASPALRERVAFYRAEALWMMGREDEAVAAFRSLASSIDRRVAWVAQTQLQSLEPAAPWRELRERFEAGGGLGVDMDAWSAYAGELAFRAGRLGDALHWLSRAGQASARRDELAEIRRADALLESERVDPGRSILRRLERRGERSVVREIAAIRLARPGVGSEGRRQARLDKAARSAAPRVAALALDALARIHLEALRPEEGLDAVVRLHTLAPRGGVPALDELTNEAVELAATTAEDCVTVVRWLAGGRDAWIRSIRKPGPLLRLGDCARDLELRATAADVYRALSRRFPNRLGSDLALRIADASWDLRERSVVESMIAANARIERTTGASFEQRAPWMRLRAEMALEDGGTQDALALLLLLAESSSTPPAEREPVVRMLVQLPIESDSAAEIGSALEATLRWDRDLLPAQMGQAWLRLADLRKHSARPDAARRAYRKASELLPVGSDAWGRSVHALSATAASGEEREALLEQLVQGEARGPWNDLARGELRLAHLRHLIERSERMAR
jgi:tetratricopeptide (TPR) repeat protein